jgi:hypothetical protein
LLEIAPSKFQYIPDGTDAAFGDHDQSMNCGTASPLPRILSG